MSMTREEATELLRYRRNLISSVDMDWCANETEALDLALSALRPVSREQVEKVWRGCSWCNNEGKKPENWECSLLDDDGFSVAVGSEVVWTNAEFCPVCGRPLTDEAVEITMRRLEDLHEEN